MGHKYNIEHLTDAEVLHYAGLDLIDVAHIPGLVERLLMAVEIEQEEQEDNQPYWEMEEDRDRFQARCIQVENRLRVLTRAVTKVFDEHPHMMKVLPELYHAAQDNGLKG